MVVSLFYIDGGILFMWLMNVCSIVWIFLLWVFVIFVIECIRLKLVFSVFGVFILSRIVVNFVWFFLIFFGLINGVDGLYGLCIYFFEEVFMVGFVLVVDVDLDCFVE